MLFRSSESDKTTFDMLDYPEWDINGPLPSGYESHAVDKMCIRDRDIALTRLARWYDEVDKSGFLTFGRVARSIPVSYTHLDVYKRQVEKYIALLILMMMVKVLFEMR